MLAQAPAGSQRLEDWKPPDLVEWKPVGTQPAAIYQPVRDGFTKLPWTKVDMDRVGMAIQLWFGNAQYDGLETSRLNYYRGPKKLGPPGLYLYNSKRKEGRPRWEGPVIVQVAYLVRSNIKILRQRLQCDVPEEQRITAFERIQQLEERNRGLEAQVAAANLIKDAYRKMKSRNKEQRERAAARLKEKVAENRKAVKVDLAAKFDTKLAAKADKQNERLAVQYEGYVDKLKNDVSVARKRAREAEAVADKVDKLRQRAMKAESNVEELKNEIDEMHEELEATEPKPDPRLALMPSWRHVRTQGRGAPTMEWGHRVCIYEQHANQTPPSAIGQNIVSVVKRTAPWLNPVAPTPATIRQCRFELRTAEEAMAARRVAAAHRVRQLGFDETTKFQDPSMVTSVLLEPTPGAPPEVVVMRAAYATGGGTSALLVKAMEDKCFLRGREFLGLWQAVCKRLYPNHVWTGPDPARCGLQRLGGGGAVQSDTCTPARCTKRLLIEEVVRQVQAKHGDWNSLSDEDKEAAVRMHTHDCWQHIRNIFLSAMSAAMSAHVKEALQVQLDAFSNYERMTTDFDAVLRADYKEFHHGGRYYKGKGKEFSEWLRDRYPNAFVMHLERAEGGRQDLDYDAAVPMYVMRRYMVEFLHEKVYSTGHSNVLEDFLYVSHCTLEYIAMMRANAIIDLIVARPMRWLCGKSAALLDWSPYSMGPVLDRLEGLFERAAQDGSVLIDPGLNFWKPVVDTQPAFRDYMQHVYTKETCRSPDGKTTHLQYQKALDELLDPSDETNKKTFDLTVEYLEVQCKAAIAKLHDSRTVLPEYLTSQDGAKCWSKVQQGHADTKGCEASNDKFSESVFGTFDRMLKRNENISREAASGLAQAIRAKSFYTGDAVKRRKAQEPPPPGFGFFYSLPVQEQHALVEFSRSTVRDMRRIDREHNAEVAAYVKSKAKTASEEELQSLIKEYGYGLSFFDRWKERGVSSVQEMTAELAKLDKAQAKLDWLREQIEMRTRGLQWVEFKTRWSSQADEHVGSVDELTEHLKEVLMEEAERRRDGELPKTAPAPLSKRKVFKELGTRTPQFEELSEKHTELSPEEMLEAAERERERLEEAGEIDRVGDQMPKEAPAFDALVGKELELRWRYWSKEGTKRKQVFIWCTGVVVEVADGKTTKAKPKAKKLLPWGAVRIKWEADSEFDEDESLTWSILKAEDWNKEVCLGWRYSAAELKKLEPVSRKRKA